MDQDQSAPKGTVWNESSPFVKEAVKTFQQITKQIFLL